MGFYTKITLEVGAGAILYSYLHCKMEAWKIDVTDRGRGEMIFYDMKNII